MTTPDDDRRRAWRLLFHGDMQRETPTPLGQFVLDQLRGYCFGQFSTEAADAQGRIDPMRMAVNEGRRQVWLAIQAWLTKPAEQEAVHERSDDDE